MFGLRTKFTGFAPNSKAGDTLRAFFQVFAPWNWVGYDKKVREVEHFMREYHSAKTAFTFDSGRAALRVGLEALGVRPGDEVLVQAYTCVVVTNAITYIGAKPVYVDIGDDLGMDVNDARNKITDKTKVIIIQHTFGSPADTDGLVSLAKEHNLKTIEDCAHALGAKSNGKLLGTSADIGMFSFGTDKVVSCVRGGALITNDTDIAAFIDARWTALSHMPRRIIVAHLLHPIVFAVGKALYKVKIGKALMLVTKKLGVTASVLYKGESEGKNIDWMPARFSPALARVVMPQLRELDNRNAHRAAIAKVYTDILMNNPKVEIPFPYTQQSGSIWLRYLIFVDKPRELNKKMAKEGVLMGGWYQTVVAPDRVDVANAGYRGDCPRAEAMAKRSTNLPTSILISIDDAKKIATKLLEIL